MARLPPSDSLHPVLSALDRIVDHADATIDRFPVTSAILGALATGGIAAGLVGLARAMQRSKDINGSVVIVTGASAGIGAGCAMEMATRGAKTVIMLARRWGELKARAAEIDATVGRQVAVPMRCDCSDARQVEEMAASVLKTYGPPDILVNNAGAGRWAALFEASPEDITAATDAPLLANMFVTRAFLPAMLVRDSGTVVFVNSPFSRVVLPGATAYCATRWGVRGLVEAVRADVSCSSLRVVELVQGATWSNYW